MYQHPTTQQNLEQLRRFGNHIIEPGSGFLASGLEGKGRMEEPEQIVAYLDNALSSPAPQASEGVSSLNGTHILITAGPTYEKIDPVRFIGNYSSGKMGFALAEECARRGAEITLVAGPVSLTTQEPNIRRIDVESCEEMYQAATDAFPQSDAAILCAAVADFRPESIAEQKIKRQGDELTIRLKPTHDIAAAIGNMKREGQVLAGFALETNDEETNAKKKLEKKHLDFIVLNSLRNKGTCFQSDDNQISILSKEGQKDFPKKTKTDVAKDIVDELESRIKKKQQ